MIESRSLPSFRQEHLQTRRQTDKQTDTQTDTEEADVRRQTDRYADVHIGSHISKHSFSSFVGNCRINSSAVILDSGYNDFLTIIILVA